MIYFWLKCLLNKWNTVNVQFPNDQNWNRRKFWFQTQICTIKPNTFAFSCMWFIAIENLNRILLCKMSFTNQTLSKFWTRCKPNGTHVSEMWTSSVFSHSLYVYKKIGLFLDLFGSFLLIQPTYLWSISIQLTYVQSLSMLKSSFSSILLQQFGFWRRIQIRFFD